LGGHRVIHKIREPISMSNVNEQPERIRETEDGERYQMSWRAVFRGSVGAVGGAVAGAVIGSVVPVFGTTIGGIIGGVAGLMRGLDSADRYDEKALKQLKRIEVPA
jgi:uncharacterized membrane protein